jgi:exopolyphosphatase/guanosine-5'-triphosphate,3'-diphosphate pyrophosphatase
MILEELAPVRNPGFRDYRLIGVAGTVTTLACLDQNLEEFDVEKVSGYTLSIQTVRAWSQRLNSMDTGSIAGLSSTTAGRADILAAGVLILSEIMIHFGFESVIASERGLRYGLVVRQWQRTRT